MLWPQHPGRFSTRHHIRLKYNVAIPEPSTMPATGDAGLEPPASFKALCHHRFSDDDALPVRMNLLASHTMHRGVCCRPKGRVVRWVVDEVLAGDMVCIWRQAVARPHTMAVLSLVKIASILIHPAICHHWHASRMSLGMCVQRPRARIGNSGKRPQYYFQVICENKNVMY